jgi:hypothetical protein
MASCGWPRKGTEREHIACRLPPRLVKVSSRLEGSALGTVSLETSPNQSLLSSPYLFYMAVLENRTTTSNPLRGETLAKAVGCVSWARESDYPLLAILCLQ